MLRGAYIKICRRSSVLINHFFLQNFDYKVLYFLFFSCLKSNPSVNCEIWTQLEYHKKVSKARFSERFSGSRCKFWIFVSTKLFLIFFSVEWYPFCIFCGKFLIFIRDCSKFFLILFSKWPRSIFIIFRRKDRNQISSGSDHDFSYLPTVPEHVAVKPEKLKCRQKVIDMRSCSQKTASL